VAEVEYDDPQIWTVAEFLKSEKDGVEDLIEEMGQKEDATTTEIAKLIHVREFLIDRLNGKYA
jgi:hypothetical protein|tara:strand:- start:157 stop:345 length:189 start_codon:yes stop_codon:yes gene_type:complete